MAKIHAEIVLPAAAPLGAGPLPVVECRRSGGGAKMRAWAREIEVSLPHELSPEDRLALVREFSQHVADRFGVAVDFAIHAPHGARRAQSPMRT